MVICFYFPLPDYHSNRTHLYYKTVKLTKFSSAVNRADSYMKLKFFYKDYFRRNKGCFTEILIKTEQIDSFHIVSAHAPNSLVPRYLREITLQGATFI